MPSPSWAAQLEPSSRPKDVDCPERPRGESWYLPLGLPISPRTNETPSPHARRTDRARPPQSLSIHKTEGRATSHRSPSSRIYVSSAPDRISRARMPTRGPRRGAAPTAKALSEWLERVPSHSTVRCSCRLDRQTLRHAVVAFDRQHVLTMLQALFLLKASVPAAARPPSRPRPTSAAIIQGAT